MNSNYTTDYTCPMHPEVRQPEPGSCPKCSMALEPAGVPTQATKTGYTTLPAKFWRSRAGMVLIAFAVIAGLLLAIEHRAHLVTGNGLLMFFLAVCIGMLFFMNSGHDGHGTGRDEEDHQ